MVIYQTPTFAKQLKKLHKKQKLVLDQIMRELAKNPLVGEEKKGDLSGMRVYKFRLVGQLVLLAYEYDVAEPSIVLHGFGSHENFYRDLKH